MRNPTDCFTRQQIVGTIRAISRVMTPADSARWLAEQLAEEFDKLADRSNPPPVEQAPFGFEFVGDLARCPRNGEYFIDICGHVDRATFDYTVQQYRIVKKVEHLLRSDIQTLARAIVEIASELGVKAHYNAVRLAMGRAAVDEQLPPPEAHTHFYKAVEGTGRTTKGVLVRDNCSHCLSYIRFFAGAATTDRLFLFDERWVAKGNPECPVTRWSAGLWRYTYGTEPLKRGKCILAAVEL